EAHNQMAAASTFDCKLNVQANQDFIDLFVQEMLTSVDLDADLGDMYKSLGKLLYSDIDHVLNAVQVSNYCC
ncbi:hypothetical protein, partial [Anaerobiospirillum succiniciproducens]|uniref:hypothetical protein n=1 Tax=Anaerobiospirillum succiniciproducens TaxID=13335 RepID=UPI003F8B0476